MWTRVALLVLLGATAVLYLWDLSASGWANDFYAAATQAGSTSWKAWFFGALDPGSVITVDKPPAALWLSGLSARIFGMSSWSLLVPQALCGVAAVGLLYGAVRRWSGPVAGLLAGAALAVTPAAALMFRFDNPDALLTLLLIAGAYCMVRSVEAERTTWLVLAGTALGFAFLTKMLQAFLVLPAFALVHLMAAPVSLRRRIGQVLAAGLAVLVSAGWWVVAVALWPSALTVAAAGFWAVVLFGRNASWHPELRYGIAVLTAVAAVGLLVASGRVLMTGLLTVGIVAGLAGPSAYAVATAATPHTGSIPSVGPASASSGGGFGGGGGPGGGTSSSALTTLLQSTTTKWAAGTTGASSAATLQLSSGKAVIAIGGFSGGDPAPTLARFQQYVASGQISYYVSGGGGMGGGGGNGAAGAIQAWVQASYTATTVGGTTVYQLTG